VLSAPPVLPAAEAPMIRSFTWWTSPTFRRGPMPRRHR